jgi:DNA-binding transcriptional LysR family regulator
MTLNDLEVFVKVCDAGSLSAVARDLGCTQPAVSQHVVRLEREVGTPLVERRANGVVPTEAGEALREAAIDSLAAIAGGLERVAEMREGSTGRVTITTGGTTVRHFLRDTVVRHRREHPDVALEFVPASSTARCIEVLRKEHIDLALITMIPEQRAVEQRLVATLDLFLLVPTDDPLTRHCRVGVEDLATTRLIGLSESSTSRAHITSAAARQGVVLEPMMKVDNFDTASLFVELGLGHALVPAVQAATFAATGRVRALPVDGLEPVPIGWACRRFSALTRSARAFVDLFDETLAELGRLPGVSLA